MSVSSETRTRRTDRLGDALTWLCGGALAINLLLSAALVGLIAINGLGYFWPRQIVLFEQRSQFHRGALEDVQSFSHGRVR